MQIDLSEILVAGVDASGSVVEKPLPPATELEVASFERQIGFDLPDDYREFLLKFNGGQPNLNKMEGVEFDRTPITNGNSARSGSTYLEYLYTLGDGYLTLLGPDFSVVTLDSSYLSFSDLQNSDRRFVPPDSVPIGQSIGSMGFLLLGLAGEYKNKVLDYYHGQDPEEPYGNVSVVGDSFTEFVNSFRIVSY